MTKRILLLAALVIVPLVAIVATSGGQSGQAPQYQEAVLEDGVTTAEMARAATSYVQCIRKLGVQGHVTFDTTQFAFSYSFFAEGGVPPGSVVESPEGKACEENFLSDVEVAWASQHQATLSEIPAMRKELADCLSVPATPAALENQFGGEGFANCLEQAYASG